MTETLLRDRVELEKQRDAEAKLNRIHSTEKNIAVLQTLFDATIKRLEDALERAVSGEDIKELKREMEEDVNKQIVHVCEHFDTKTAQQSKDILHEVRMMLSTQQAMVSEEQKRTRQEIIRYGVGFALTILAALVIFWLTGRG